MRLRLTIATVILLGLSAPAHAQDAIVEGPGHRVGESTVFHPSAGLEAGYVSNVFYMSDNTVGAPILRLLADFAIASEESTVETETLVGDDEETTPTTPPKLRFRAGLRLVREQYVNSNSNIGDQSNFGGGVGGKMTAFPKGTFAFRLTENFTRSTRPKNFESTGNLNRDVNHLMLGLTFQPGGRAIKAALRYENTIDVFESNASSFANRMNQLIGLGADWQFLPITKFYFDASLGFFGPLGDTAAAYKNSSMPLRVLVGGASSITERTTARIHIGYGNGFYSAGPNFGNVLFGAEGGYRYSPLGRTTLSYQYGFTDSVNANFYRDHALIGKVDQQLGLVVLSGSLALRLRSYRGISPVIGGATDRSDFIVHGKVTGQYYYRDWLAFTGEAAALIDATDYTYDPEGDGSPYDPSFARYELWLGTRAAF